MSILSKITSKFYRPANRDSSRYQSNGNSIIEYLSSRTPVERLSHLVTGNGYEDSSDELASRVYEILNGDGLVKGNNRVLGVYLDTKKALELGRLDRDELSRQASTAVKRLVSESDKYRNNGQDDSHLKSALKEAAGLRAMREYAENEGIIVEYKGDVDPNEIPISDRLTSKPSLPLSKLKRIYKITKDAIEGPAQRKILAQEFVQDYVPRLEETTKKPEVSTGIHEFVPTELERLLGKEIGYVRRNIELLTDRVANVFSAAIDNMANIDPQKAIKYAKRTSKKLPELLQYKSFQDVWSKAEIEKNKMSRWNRFWNWKLI